MKIFSRFSFKFAVSTLLISLIFLLICVFLVPPILKNALLQSKQSYMTDNANLIISSVTKNGIDTVFSSVPGNGNLRLIHISSTLEVLSDTSREDNLEKKIMAFPGIKRALSGKSFYNAYAEDNAFVYSLLCPLDGDTGLLYIRYTDTDTAKIFKASRQACNFSGILMFVLPVSLLIHHIVNFSKRLNKLAALIEELASGKFSAEITANGSDELSQVTKLLESYSIRQAHTDELRRRFVSDASHELKTPLAAVKLLSDTILFTPDMKKDDIQEFLTDISNEIDRLTRICTRLLQITQFDTFSTETELVPLNLTTVAENVSHMLSQPANAAGLELRCELQDGCYVRANYDLVFQVFYNLIENAIKYGADGEDVRVFLYQKDSHVVFIVDDDGIGIPESDLERIFDRFYRVDKARSRATGGTGLGLSIVETAVQNCNGTVEAQNRKPHGARFIVKFPASPYPPDETEGSL